MRRILSILCSALCIAAASAAPVLNTETVNQIIQQQFGSEFEVIKTKPAYVVQKLRTDGRRDLVAVLTVKNPSSNVSPPQSAIVTNPFPSQEEKSSFWNDFVTGKLNAIAVVHADSEDRFDGQENEKFLLVGPSAMALSSPQFAGDKMMKPSVVRFKEGKKSIRLPSVEFGTMLDVGWIYWKEGSYRWRESEVYD